MRGEAPLPNFRFEAASLLTKNGILDIVEQLGPNPENLDRHLGAQGPRGVGT